MYTMNKQLINRLANERLDKFLKSPLSQWPLRQIQFSEKKILTNETVMISHCSLFNITTINIVLIINNK
jgi:hypothetical protein